MTGDWQARADGNVVLDSCVFLPTWYAVNMDNRGFLIAVVIGLPFIGLACFTVMTFRHVDPNSPSWQRTCRKSLVTSISLIALFMGVVAFAPYPYFLLAIIPLALCTMARSRFIGQAARHAKMLRDTSDKLLV